jgi:hypothetical protein
MSIPTLETVPPPTMVRSEARAALVEVSPPTDGDWRSAIAADAFALPEQSPEWIRAIVESSGARDASRAYHFADGTTLVLPMVRTGLAGSGSLWSPPPAWGVGGLVGPTADADMVRQVVDDLRSIRAPRIMVRIDVRHHEHWQAAMHPGDLQIPRRSHVIDLFADPEAHFAQLAKRTRTKIRKCERDGVRIEADRTGELLETHHELFLTSVGRWADKQHEPLALALFRARRRDPIEKLQAMQRALGDRFLTLVAYIDGRPAASVIVLLGKTSRYTRGAMDIELVGNTNANYGLQWHAIRAAYEHGSTRYHMGESGESAGIATFKERMGAQPIDHCEYRFERLPVTRTTDLVRNGVKRVIGFSDT